MSVIIICNFNVLEKYYSTEYSEIVINLNLKPIFMYDLEYSKNNEIELKDSTENTLYETVITYSQKDKQKTIEVLKHINIVAIIPYTEDDVLDAEYFSHCLGTPSNPIETTMCRRDKFEMQEKIKMNGLTSINQKKCSTLSDINEFVSGKSNIKYVIKPIHGAASEDVYLCKNLYELHKRFNQMINKKNNCDIVNSECLVQEFIDGEDWIVNSVSRNGIHKIVNVMRSYKTVINDREFMYIETSLINAKDVPHELCIYAINLLNALDIKNGAGHAEIKLSSNGPCLIEIGARVGGAQYECALSKCIKNNYGQLKATIYSYCDGKLFNEIPNMYSNANELYRCITVNNLYDSIVWNDRYMNNLLHQLNAFVVVHKISHGCNNGDVISKTQDLLTIIARLFITSECENKLKNALSIVKKWEVDLCNQILLVQ